jgi:hypothetical protein
MAPDCLCAARLELFGSHGINSRLAFVPHLLTANRSHFTEKRTSSQPHYGIILG